MEPIRDHKQQIHVGDLKKCCEHYNCRSATPPVKRNADYRPPPLPWDGKICKHCGAFCSGCSWLELLGAI